MGEVTRKSGATKKAAGQGEAPLLLKDGKTVANEAALTRALHRYGLPVPATAAEKLAAVRAHIEADLREKLASHQCDDSCDDPATSQCPMVACACTEVSTLDTDFCPFCGDLGLPPDAQVVVRQDGPQLLVGLDVPQPVAASAPQAQGNSVEPEVKEEEEGDGVEPEITTPLPGDGDDSDAHQLAPRSEVLPPAPADKAAALDAAVVRIEQLKGDLNKNTWELAAELKRVQDDELYKVRGYENFGAWAVGEVQLSRSLAYELVRVASEFDEATYLQVGSTKLRLVASIEDPEKRQAALEDAKGGASKRELEAKHTTRTVTRDAPPPESPRGKSSSAPPPEPAKPREAPKKGNEIQLLAKLNGRATTHPFLSSKTGREVREYQEDAYVEVRLADNVVVHAAPKYGSDGKKLVGLTFKFIETVEPS